MARPAKSVKVKSGDISTADAEVRAGIEDKLRGEAQPPEPPPHLSDAQRELFEFIVGGLVNAEILGRLDVFVLESTVVAIDRLREINRMIDADLSLLANNGLQSARAKYQRDLWRGCSELCLSPQARAKIGGLAAQKAKEAKDPLVAAMMDDD